MRCLKLPVWNEITLCDRVVKQGGGRDYPSAFVMKKDKTITFIGNWGRIQEYLDMDSIDKATLDAHPEIVTFSRFFQ